MIFTKLPPSPNPALSFDPSSQELLIGILVAIAAVSYNSVTKSAKESALKSE